MKRISFIFISLILCCCFVFGCISVSAEDIELDGHTVVDYMDYITGYDLSLVGDGWAYLNFGSELFTSYKEDYKGYETSTSGDKYWNIYIKNGQSTSSAHVVSQVPGGGANDTFLSLNNIPNGSVFEIQAFAEFENLNASQTDVLVTLFSGIKYYDANFNYISGYHNEEIDYVVDGTDGEGSFYQGIEIPVNKPANAMYAVLYSRMEFGVDRTNDISLQYIKGRCRFTSPYLKISTSYTQIIVQSIVQAKPPEGYGTIIDLGELEAILTGQTQQGQQSADQLFQTGPEVIGGFLSGFTFMSVVFSSLTSHNWVYSLLTVSLALGLFNYIVNGVMSAGRSLEHKGGKGGGKK